MADKEIRLLRFPGTGGNLSSIYQKYGNLKPYELERISKDIVNIRFSLDGTFDGYIKFDERFYYYEQTLPKFDVAAFLKTFLNVLFLSLKYDINIIHSNTPFYFAIPTLFVAKLLRIPFCVSIHADYTKREALQGDVIPRLFGSLRLTRALERFVYQHADRIFPIRESLIKYLLESGCSEEKIRIFPHGIDLSPFQKNSIININNFFGIPFEAKVISSIGRIEKENYSDDIAAIAIKSTKADEKLYFIICGDGSQLEKLKRQVEANGLSSRIFFPGFVSHDIAIELRKQSFINLCLMGGFSLIEACASGRPVITYNVEWHYELIKNRETGFLIKEGDIESVVDVIIELLTNPDRGRLIGENARKVAIERHSIETTSKIKKNHYEELL